MIKSLRCLRGDHRGKAGRTLAWKWLWKWLKISPPMILKYMEFTSQYMGYHGDTDNESMEIRPHRRCWGVIFRMALVKGYRFTWGGGGGGGIFRPKPPVFDRSWRSPSKNTVKNSTEDTCSWTRPSKIGKRKVNFLTSIFWFATSFFAVPQVAWPGGGFLRFWTRFRTDFRRFVIAETLVFTVFLCFLHAWRLASKLPKTS